MALFRKSKNKKPERHELLEIPIGSMIELSDPITFEMSDAPTRTFELIERKKYEGDAMLRYMYILEDDDEQVALGVDRVGSADEYELSRWIIDNEEELDELDLEDAEEAGGVLDHSITLYYPDPEDEDTEIDIEYVRQEIVPVNMTVVNDEEMNEYDAELHEYTNEDDGLMSVELCGTWLTFYVGESIAQTDVQIYPAEEEPEYI